MKKIIFTVMLALVITGCQSKTPKEETKTKDTTKTKEVTKKDDTEVATCILENKELLQKSTTIFTMKDNEIVEIEEILIDDFSLDSDMTISSFVEGNDEQVKDYKETDYFTFSYEEIEDKVYESTLTYNLDDYDVSELLIDEMLDGTDFKLEVATSYLEKDGYICTTK